MNRLLMLLQKLLVSVGQLEDGFVDVSLEQPEDHLVRDTIVVHQVLSVLRGHEAAPYH